MTEIEKPKSEHPPMSTIVGAGILAAIIAQCISGWIHYPLVDWQRLIVAILAMLLTYRFL